MYGVKLPFTAAKMPFIHENTSIYGVNAAVNGGSADKSGAGVQGLRRVDSSLFGFQLSRDDYEAVTGPIAPTYSPMKLLRASYQTAITSSYEIATRYPVLSALRGYGTESSVLRRGTEAWYGRQSAVC